MACQDYRDLMMAYLDEELNPDEQQRFQAHLATCPACTQAFDEFKSLKTMTDGMTLAEPEARIWENYWGQVYNRAERSIGWILFSLAGICLITYGGFKLIETIVSDAGMALTLRCVLLVFIAGLTILVMSVMRERFYFWRHDRYKDIRR
ncbi:anti-sigma factor family protein [Planctomycetota bacterium]